MPLDDSRLVLGATIRGTMRPRPRLDCYPLAGRELALAWRRDRSPIITLCQHESKGIVAPQAEDRASALEAMKSNKYTR